MKHKILKISILLISTISCNNNTNSSQNKTDIAQKNREIYISTPWNSFLIANKSNTLFIGTSNSVNDTIEVYYNDSIISRQGENVYIITPTKKGIAEIKVKAVNRESKIIAFYKFKIIDEDSSIKELFK